MLNARSVQARAFHLFGTSNAVLRMFSRLICLSQNRLPFWALAKTTWGHHFVKIPNSIRKPHGFGWSCDLPIFQPKGTPEVGPFANIGVPRPLSARFRDISGRCRGLQDTRTGHRTPQFTRIFNVLDSGATREPGEPSCAMKVDVHLPSGHGCSVEAFPAMPISELTAVAQQHFQRS